MRVIWAAALCCFGSALAAGTYDGIYQPAGMSWSCKRADIGMDGGAMAVQNGSFYRIESVCKMTNPVTVRGMNATLFDAVCTGEGESYSFRMMLMKTGDGLVFVEDGYATTLRRC